MQKVEDRIAQLMNLQQSLQNWEPISQHLMTKRDELVSRLIAKEDPEVRGRIKELNSLLELPQRLQQEAVQLRQPQQEGELP